MERCQSGCTSTDFVDTVIEVRNTTIHMVNRFRVGRYLVIQSRQVFTSRVRLFDEVAVFCNSRFVIELTAINGIGRAFFYFAVCYIGNLLVISIQTTIAYIGLAINL